MWNWLARPDDRPGPHAVPVGVAVAAGRQRVRQFLPVHEVGRAQVPPGRAQPLGEVLRAGRRRQAEQVVGALVEKRDDIAYWCLVGPAGKDPRRPAWDERTWSMCSLWCFSPLSVVAARGGGERAALVPASGPGRGQGESSGASSRSAARGAAAPGNRWQRTWRPGPGYSGPGMVVSHTAIRAGQRAANGQPCSPGRAAPGRPAAAGAGPAAWPSAPGHRSHQELGVGVAGVGDQFPARSRLQDLARVHDQGVAGGIAGAGQVVGDQQHPDAALRAQVGQQVQDAHPDRHVQHRGRLVSDDHPRPGREHARDGHPLPLPAGQLVRIALGDAGHGLQPDVAQQRGDGPGRQRPAAAVP